MNAKEVFESGRDLIELAGLFMVILPIFTMCAITLALYFKKN